MKRLKLHSLRAIIPILSLSVSVPMLLWLFPQRLFAQETQTDTQSTETSAWSLVEQGAQQLNTGEFTDALDLFQRALLIFQETDNRQGEGYALVFLGRVYDATGEYQTALSFYQSALTIFTGESSSPDEQLFLRQGESTTLNNMGSVYRALGHYLQALEYYQQTLAIQHEIGDRFGEGVTLNNIGLVYGRLGDYAQALDYYQHALVIRHEMGDRPGEGQTLNNIGEIYDNLGDYPQALDYYQQALAISRETGNRPGEGITLNNIGLLYAKVGDYPQALDYYQQALAISRDIGDRPTEGTLLNNIGVVYAKVGDYPQALDYYRQALAISRDIGDYPGEGGTLNNIGLVYANLGNYFQALDYFQQALIIRVEIGDRAGESTIRNNIGDAYRNLGDYSQALTYYQQALVIQQEIGDRAGEGGTLNNIGLLHRDLKDYAQALDYLQQALPIQQEIGDRAGEGRILTNMGDVYRNLGDYSQALNYNQQALNISREIGDRTGEGSTLTGLGSMYYALEDYPQSLSNYQQALTIQHEIGDRSGEATTLNNLGFVLDAMGESELAIVFFKQSVNRWEAIRSDIRDLAIRQQQSFIDSVSSSYRRLADLLLQENRVLEAQEILDLLKLQELDEYDLNVQEISQRMEFWPAEQDILNVFAQYQDADAEFSDFLTQSNVRMSVEQLQRDARGQNLNPAQLAGLQDNLQDLGYAALLYPLILDDRLELILVTENGLVRETVPVSRTELNDAIASFRTAITNRLLNPVAQAQKLYQWLLASIADDLKQANVETILYAADGALRYIPLAALHDGEQWLTQRYTINHITAASLTDFSQAETVDLSILAGAFPADDVEVDLGTERVWFRGLPFAQAEVEHLVNQIPGTAALFSRDFNRAAIEPQLDNYTILHLATHAEFRSGHPTDSFILLGDGDRITLYDLNQWQLPNVELVVLSACKTAVSETLGNGDEILGFGYQIQQTGALAAIASLWQVSDGGTQALMDAFYTALQNGHSKAEALQRAQRALITGDATVLSRNSQDVEIEASADDDAILTVSERSPSGNTLSHPYYWAPFILIGNGL